MHKNQLNRLIFDVFEPSKINHARDLSVKVYKFEGWGLRRREWGEDNQLSPVSCLLSIVS